MRNIDKYKEELLLNTIACSIAVNKDTREVKPCNLIKCTECLFNGTALVGCTAKRLEWLQAEYEEPEVDWSKVAVDMPIYVRNIEGDDWAPRHFAKYEGGKIYAWANGMTSHTIGNRSYCNQWKYAKLAEGKHEED